MAEVPPLFLLTYCVIFEKIKIIRFLKFYLTNKYYSFMIIKYVFIEFYNLVHTVGISDGEKTKHYNF